MKQRWRLGRLVRVARLSLFLVILYAGSTRAMGAYSIQVGAFPSFFEADAERARYDGVCPPVAVLEIKDDSGFPYKVLVGGFETYAEAWVYRTRLAAEDAPGCFVTMHDSGLRSLPKCPSIMPFDVRGIDAPEPENAAQYWAAGGFDPPDVPRELLTLDTSLMARSELVRLGLSATKYPREGGKALEYFIAGFPGDSMSNRAKLVLGRLLARGADTPRAEKLLTHVAAVGSLSEKSMAKFLRGHLEVNRKRPAAAFALFCAVASDASNPPSLRREAMARAAASAHAAGMYPESWLAFRQVEATALNEGERAKARLECAGLAYELMTRGKGNNWDEVRALCAAVTNTTGALRHTRATADLMVLETLFEEKRYEEALAEVQLFCVEYPDVSREFHMARVWHGIILFKLNLLDEAAVVLESVATTKISTAEKFGGDEPRANAGVWLAWIRHKQGRVLDRDKWVGMLNQEFPGTSTTIEQLKMN